MFLFLSDKTYIATKEILSIHASTSAPIKRIISAAKKSDTLIDTTGTKMTRSVIITLNGTIYTSSVSPETLIKRLTSSNSEVDDPEQEGRQETKQESRQKNKLNGGNNRPRGDKHAGNQSYNQSQGKTQNKRP